MYLKPSLIQDSSFPTYIELGFGLGGGGHPDLFMGGLPSCIGGLLSITSIGGSAITHWGVASSKF